MNNKNRLYTAVVCGIASWLGTAPATAQNVIEEVTVTATKREESAQDIPVTVQALDESTLRELQIGNFDDYVSFMPGVTSGGRGPGQSSIYIRGMATSTISVQLAGANGSAPNVALYLDEQPVTIVGRNLDVYVTDMERIEVLPGPQGTLFGSSSMAGTVRLIINKPAVNEFQAGVEAGLASTSDGESSHSIEGYLNLPLIDDKFAARIAFYDVNLGGYVDNVAGEKRISLDNPVSRPATILTGTPHSTRNSSRMISTTAGIWERASAPDISSMMIGACCCNSVNRNSKLTAYSITTLRSVTWK